ncbi:MAG: CPBP family intramembrane glutamic endopeptidase [Candidatus Hydrogenedentota bacterium]
MRTALLVFLGLHVVHSLIQNGRGKPDKRRKLRANLILIQMPLFVLAFYIAYREGALGRSLLNPAYILGGLVLGHAVFVVSLLVIHRCVADAREVLLGFGAIGSFIVESPVVLSRYVGVAITEEIIYRAAAQQSVIALLGNPWAGIALTAVLFSIVHAHFFRNSFSQSFEFVLFGVLLGVLYWVTQSLIFVIAIHAIRNIEIAYLEFLGKLEELGNEEQALQEVERSVVHQQSDLA